MKSNLIFFIFSCGPSNGEMVSRRKILSRSRDDLNLDGPVPNSEQDEEDIWYNKEKLYKVSKLLQKLGCLALIM